MGHFLPCDTPDSHSGLYEVYCPLLSDFKQCILSNIYWCFSETCCLSIEGRKFVFTQDGGIMILLNFVCLQIYTALHRSRLLYSAPSFMVFFSAVETSISLPPNSWYLTLRRLMSYIYIYIYIYMERIFLMFLDHTERRSTVCRTPLDEWSARRRDLYLTTHNTQTNIHAPAGIRTHDLSSRAAADLRLRPRGHWFRASWNNFCK